MSTPETWWRRGLHVVLDERHHFEIAVTQMDPDGSFRTCVEWPSSWPYRCEEPVAELGSIGLIVETMTSDSDGAGYLLVARAPVKYVDERRMCRARPPGDRLHLRLHPVRGRDGGGEP